MSGLSRKEMKRDEVREWIERAIIWASENGKNLAIGAGAVVGAILLGIVVWSIDDRRKEKAQERLADALWADAAVIDPDSPNPDDPQEPSFASEEAREAEVMRRLGEVGGGKAGQIAKLYEAAEAAKSGDVATARDLWTKFLAKNKDYALAAQVQLNLIELDKAEGNFEKIVADLEKQEGNGPLPSDALLFELGSALRELGRVDEANEKFQELVDEFPASGYRADAARYLEEAT